MPKHLYVLLVLTFFIGIVSGGYAFFLTRDEADTVEAEPETGYEIVAYTYGGCERLGCSSYRIRDDASYTYIPRAQAGDRFDDALTERQAEELDTFVSETDYEELRMTTFVGTCPAQYDGIAYRFEIRVEAERYSIDSCVENLDTDPLFLFLVKLFDIMQVTHEV